MCGEGGGRFSFVVGVLVVSFCLFFRRGVMTASLNHRCTGQVNSDSFTILQIKGTKSSKYVLNQVVGM